MSSKPSHSVSSNPICSVSICAGSQTDMRAMSPSECDQCVTECDAESCAINLGMEQCTDRCLVVPCEEQCLEACDSCFGPSQTVCDSSTECQGLTEGYTSATPAHPEAAFSLRQSNVDYSYPRLDWSSAPEDIEAFLCACNVYNHSHQFRQDTCINQYAPSSQTRAHSSGSNTAPLPLLHYPGPASLERASTPSSPASALFSPVPTSNSSLRSTPDISTGSTLLHASTSDTIQQEAYPGEEGDRCLWGDCGVFLPSSQHLTDHLTTNHLSQYFGQHYEHPSNSFPVSDGSQEKIPCLWNNCNIYPSVSSNPNGADSASMEAYIELLLRHIQQDHMGLPHVPIENVQTLSSGHTSPDSFVEHDITPYGKTSDSHPGQPELFCHWRSCPLAAVPFLSPADLTQHLTDVHVGMGSSRYHCYWGDCRRHGESGFSSKQKILRHIQSHTGYRPFKCELCDQHFSEAATLQQHMRRHTKEKPFTCPEPGCGKSFAIAGALTIHRRVHTGSKPFKCKYCNRSFSESSNLSKHIRTHTGDRPYSCNFPGCDKRFARPDQATRHRLTHDKKKPSGTERDE